MKTIGIFEAKTHFSEIVDDIVGGQEYLITKRGQPLVRMVRNVLRDQKVVDEAVCWLKAFRNKHHASQTEIKAWKNEGRKH